MSAEIPSVNQGIVDLTDRVMERIGPRVAIYASDSRRRIGSSVVLKARETVFWDYEQGYGMAGIGVRQDSSRAISHTLVTSPQVKEVLGQLIDSEQSDQLASGMKRPKKLLAARVALFVMRDRFPQGHIGHRYTDGELYGDRDYNPEVWGDLHRVGVALACVFGNMRTQSRTDWNFSLGLQNRFDRPEPELRATSRVDRIKNINARPVVKRGEERIVQAVARGDHLKLMTRLVALAKNLRPTVDPAQQLLIYNRQLARLAEDLQAS